MNKRPVIDGFINSVSEDEIIDALKTMQRSPKYLTQTAYRPNAEKWPNNEISFIEIHLNYLKANPGLNPHHYLANLKLKLNKTPRR